MPTFTAAEDMKTVKFFHEITDQTGKEVDISEGWQVTIESLCTDTFLEPNLVKNTDQWQDLPDSITTDNYSVLAFDVNRDLKKMLKTKGLKWKSNPPATVVLADDYKDGLTLE